MRLWGGNHLNKYIWLLIYALFLGLAWFFVESKLVWGFEHSGPIPIKFWMLGAFIGVLGLWLFNFFINPLGHLKIQKIHSQPSWVFYTYFALIAAPLFSDGVKWLISGDYDWGSLYIRSVALILGLVFYYRKQGVIRERRRFASGSVGSKDDEFGFKIFASHVHEGLIKLNNYVSVVALYGGLGFGKSSCGRMIIESFDEKKVLYSYISLTETNEAKDFSKLFTERWLETLTARYPKIDATSYLPFMSSVLRESGYGFFSRALEIISALNPGLLKTRAKYFDAFYEERPEYTSKGVGRLFGNIPDISEDNWVIMVDEIERGQLDEIYRLIEIIERFKNEGRDGLPVKVIFFLCVSRADLQSLLDIYNDNDVRACLLNNFFFKHPKSITKSLFLPPVDSEDFKEFIVKKVNMVRQEEGLEDDLRDIKQIYPNTIADPNRSFLNKHTQALEYILGVLFSESPRMITRVMDGLRFFYSIFRDQGGAVQKNAIRFSDLLALEYIKIKYPVVIEFFGKTISFLVHQQDRNNLDSYFLHQKFKESKEGLIEWIEQETDYEFSAAEKKDVQKLIGLVAHTYQDFIERDYNIKVKDQYMGTTSYPEILHDYLSLTSNSIETAYRRFNKVYLEHKTSSNVVDGLSNEDLLGYSRFLIETGTSRQDLYLNVLTAISSRVLQGQILLRLRNIGDTTYDEAVYQLIFQILSIIEHDKSSGEQPSTELQATFDIFEKFILSPQINTGAKYIILNSFANEERGGYTGIHQRLQGAFIKLKGYYPEVLNLIKHVFSEAEARYLNGDEVIYKKEENFFYVLYQGWSGNRKNKEEISKIRKAALRGLEGFPDAIALYWERYDVKEGWRSFQDVLRSDPFFDTSDRNNSLYMPLVDLIAVTKRANIKDQKILAKLAFWESVSNDPLYKEKAELKDSSDTLKSVLLRNKLLEV